ncbi:MAG TPA: CYTH domain-containing protein, partial [Candidatus Wallbacteria bacterium]|nr:CYTH domain-containing protein [Candidatus Wallbacteria bacterium]
CRQGYLSTAKERIVRVRTIDGKGYLTVKGITAGATRAEYEYEIPAAEADEMLANLCEKPLVEKNRYKIKQESLTWEIDEFLGDNLGLIVVEIELKDEAQEFEKPSWIGQEVTGDPKYFNSSLAKNPYSKWNK